MNIVIIVRILLAFYSLYHRFSAASDSENQADHSAVALTLALGGLLDAGNDVVQIADLPYFISAKPVTTKLSIIFHEHVSKLEAIREQLRKMILNCTSMPIKLSFEGFPCSSNATLGRSVQENNEENYYRLINNNREFSLLDRTDYDILPLMPELSDFINDIAVANQEDILESLNNQENQKTLKNMIVSFKNLLLRGDYAGNVNDIKIPDDGEQNEQDLAIIQRVRAEEMRGYTSKYFSTIERTVLLRHKFEKSPKMKGNSAILELHPLLENDSSTIEKKLAECYDTYMAVEDQNANVIFGVLSELPDGVAQSGFLSEPNSTELQGMEEGFGGLSASHYGS